MIKIGLTSCRNHAMTGKGEKMKPLMGITVFLAMLFWHETPLLSMQLLWINLVTDSLPAIALGMEPVESDVMDRKPKPKNEGLFANGLGVRVVLMGAMFAALSLVAFFLGSRVLTPAGMDPLKVGQTMAFMTLAISQVLHSFNMRSDKSLFKIGPFGNSKLNWAALASLALVCIVLFTPVRIAFGLELLTPTLYLIALGLILVPTVIMEFCKLVGLIREK